MSTLSPVKADPLFSQRITAAVLFGLTALGEISFAVIHVFLYFGGVAESLEELAHDHGDESHNHLAEIADFVNQPSGIWMLVVFYALPVAVAALPLIWRTRIGAWVTVIVGGLLALLHTFDGFSHAFTEGNWAALVAAVVAIAIPGVFAVIATLKLTRGAAS